MRRSLLSLALAFLISSTLPAATASLERIPDGVLQTSYRIERVAGDLRVPWELAFLPDGRIIFTEREGRVRIIENGTLVKDPALTIDVALGNKMGMLGIVANPDFKKNGFIYVAYDYRIEPKAGDKRPPFRLRVARYRLDGNRLVEPHTLIEDIPASVNHTGCRLVFGPDGRLYITTGDADQPPGAQRLDTLNGKILRLDPDGSVPKDNPFVGRKDARGEIWSYGHRNPQGLAFEPGTDRLLDTEHGPGGGDEINWVKKGHNYGWPVIDHARTQAGMESPVFEFTPSVAPGEALFYTGDAFPELKGTLLVACLRGEGLLRIQKKDGMLGDVDRLFRQQLGRIRSVTQSPEGYIYLTTSQFDPAEGTPRPTYDLIVRLVPKSAPASAYPTITLPAPLPQSELASGTMGIIERNCASCHGPGLIGGGMAQGLLGGNWKYATDGASLRKIITEGLIDKGMPGSPQLSASEVDGLIAYLRKATPKN